MKKNVFKLTTIFLLMMSLFLPIHAANPVNSVNLDSLSLKSQNYILYNLEHDEVLSELNADAKLPQASLTKMMSVITALDYFSAHSVDLNSTYTITYDDLAGLLAADASIAGFVENETLTIMDILYGAMLPSGADATNALAHLVSPTIPEFVALMNEKAKSLDMLDSNYMNPSGLHDSNHYTTARDQLKLMKYAYQNETFKTLISTKEYTTTKTVQHPEGLVMSSTLLKYFTSDKTNANLYYNPYLIGGKTGQTEEAGLCLASIASHENTTYFMITLNAPATVPAGLWHIEDANKVYLYLYENFKYVKVLEKDKIYAAIPIKDGASEYKVGFNDDINLLTSINVNTQNLTVEVIPQSDHFIAPISSGTKMATLMVKDGSTVVYQQDMVLENTIERSVFAKVLAIVVIILKWLLVLIVILAVVLFGLRRFNKHKLARKRQLRSMKK